MIQEMQKYVTIKKTDTDIEINTNVNSRKLSSRKKNIEQSATVDKIQTNKANKPTVTE